MEITNYDEAFQQFKGKSLNDTIKLEEHMLMLHDSDSICLTYMNEPLVRYYQDGKLTIYEDEECGTAVVRNKLNKYTPDCIKITQRDFIFHVVFYGVDMVFIGNFICYPDKKEVYHEKVGL